MPSESAPSPVRRLLLAPAVVATLALAVIAFAGFFPTYFGRFPRFAGTTTAIHFHAVTLVLWIGLALVQAVLVRRGRTDLHRRVGKLAYVLIPFMILGFALAVIDGQRRHGATSGPPIAAAFFDAGLFVVYVGLGLLNRHRSEYHRRYMILSLIPFINPALGRLILPTGILPPMITIPVQVVILVALLARARWNKTLMRPYAIGLAVYVAALAGLMLAMPSPP